MENIKSSKNGHFTAIERTSFSFPARIVQKQNKLVDKILDFVCGIGKYID
jgi:hypothetical protein